MQKLGWASPTGSWVLAEMDKWMTNLASYRCLCLGMRIVEHADLLSREMDTWTEAAICYTSKQRFHAFNHICYFPWLHFEFIFPLVKHPEIPPLDIHYFGLTRSHSCSFTVFPSLSLSPLLLLCTDIGDHFTHSFTKEKSSKYIYLQLVFLLTIYHRNPSGWIDIDQTRTHSFLLVEKYFM